MTKKDSIASLSVGLLIAMLSLIISKNIGINFIYLLPSVALFPLLSFSGLFVSSLVLKKIPVLFQAAKFLLVGALNTFVDLGVLNLLILLFSVEAGFLFSIFKGSSFAVAVINSYAWNKYWTFESAAGDKKKEFSKFLVVSIIGFILNVGIASLLVNILKAPEGIDPKVWANIAALFATIASMVWNFTGYKLMVFKK